MFDAVHVVAEVRDVAVSAAPTVARAVESLDHAQTWDDKVRISALVGGSFFFVWSVGVPIPKPNVTLPRHMRKAALDAYLRWRNSGLGVGSSPRLPVDIRTSMSASQKIPCYDVSMTLSGRLHDVSSPSLNYLTSPGASQSTPLPLLFATTYDYSKLDPK
jgi:hypothetical protein